MKTKIILIALLASVVSLGAQAQSKGDFRVNGGLNFIFDPYGIGDSEVGFGFGGEYLFTDVISVAPSIYFFDGGSLFSADVRYYFLTGDFQAYGKAGFQNANGDGGFSEAGIGLGAGGIYNVSSNVGLNVELIYSLIKPDAVDDPLGLIANFGVVYTF